MPKRQLVDTVNELLHVKNHRSYLNRLEKRLTFPGKEESLDHEEKPSIPPAKKEQRKRFLVIDDDADQQKLFKTVLTEEGYEVLEAPDGQTGLQLYRQHLCNLVITDIFMPIEDGIETIFDLKTQDSAVKIIAITGGGSWSRYGGPVGAEDSLDIARHFGADRTLEKPIKLQQLVTVVEELLNT